MANRCLAFAICCAVLTGPLAALAEDGFTETLYRDIDALSLDEDFPRLSGPWQLAFPDDMGPHPNARAETWVIAAHLETESGDPVSLQVSLSRLGLRAPDPDGGFFDLSAIYRGHVILLPGPGSPAIAEERVSRGGGAAGDDIDKREFWLDDWRISVDAVGGLTLAASPGDRPIILHLTPERPALSQNTSGDTPFRGFAVSRMTTEGRVGEAAVTGTAWLDRAWGEVPVPGGPLGYDRLILQLDDGTDIGLLRTRRRDGVGTATLDGALVAPDGAITAVTDDTLAMTVQTFWQPDDGAASYPVAWTLAGAGLDLRLTPLRADQRHDFLFPLWSGGVAVEGTRDGVPVTGSGTLQLTGYEGQ